MSRQILCRKCGDGYKLHPEDGKMGFAFRKTYLSCALPEGHGLRLNGVFTPLADLYCDLCNEVVTGNIVVAVSMWRHEQHTIAMREWEPEYGTVLATDVVALHDKLAGKEAA